MAYLLLTCIAQSSSNQFFFLYLDWSILNLETRSPTRDQQNGLVLGKAICAQNVGVTKWV